METNGAVGVLDPNGRCDMISVVPPAIMTGAYLFRVRKIGAPLAEFLAETNLMGCRLIRLVFCAKKAPSWLLQPVNLRIS